MRLAATLTVLSMIALAGPGLAQSPKLGQYEIKAYQKIPKAKIAVQLTSDTHLSRELRREVMERLSRRGNEVGFSGGNIMRMDVSYIDLSGSSGPGNSYGPPSYRGSGANPMPDVPQNPVFRRDDPYAKPRASATLRVTLTLYAVDTGKVIWAATASCSTPGDISVRTGEAMVDVIFDNADRSIVGDAGCPI